ncbi:PI-PLC domain-containing protein [Leptospira levettii]|uniref:hypothetical protein n=1 Tax=Leptospira levettii TaxID=2023178 RepID=UPI000C2A2E8C|nr:hypothetical protein [Leptospira levettii]MCW7472079.1 hypothetical protein [Leptospira levettii]PJZ89435.1 hypothetical protein CH368_06640 [Leptospira levettii]
MSNTKFIAHRINSSSGLLEIPEDVGVEIDLRDFGDKLILAHDPFIEGEDFEKYLSQYKQTGTLILNVKSERIEYKILEILKKYDITNYFFLDSSFPMIYKLANEGEANIAIRFSEFEGMDTIRNMAGKVKWVWVDCFSEFPLNKEIEIEIHSLGYSLCLVSPELQGRDYDIEKYSNYIKQKGIKIDAICSKIYNRDRWKLVI